MFNKINKNDMRILVDTQFNDRKIKGVVNFEDGRWAFLDGHSGKELVADITYRKSQISQLKINYPLPKFKNAPIFWVDVSDDKWVCLRQGLKINFRTELLDCNLNPIFQDDYLTENGEDVYFVVAQEQTYVYVENIDDPMDFRLLSEGQEFSVIGNVLEGIIDYTWHGEPS